MIRHQNMSMTESLAQFRCVNRLDLQASHRPIWMAQLGHFIMPLPNFKWRREVIDRHDVHHLITGYETTPSGELALAAWELGVKCYVTKGARGLCFILAVLGVLYQPRMTYRAYKRGKCQAKLYAILNQTGFMDMSLQDVQATLAEGKVRGQAERKTLR